MDSRNSQEIVDACNDCADACERCASACLKEDDPGSMAACIALDMDCAPICRLTASYLARDSEFTSVLCQLCAQVCTRCAEECGRHLADHCQACARACQRCAEVCGD
jgi:hypothetical protein